MANATPITIINASPPATASPVSHRNSLQNQWRRMGVWAVCAAGVWGEGLAAMQSFNEVVHYKKGGAVTQMDVFVGF